MDCPQMSHYPYSQSGYAIFGISRNPQDQPAIDAMAGDLLTKRQLNNLSALIDVDVRQLKFDSDEAAMILAHPSAIRPTVRIGKPSDSNLALPIMFYQYAMTVDYVLAWIRNLSSRIDAFQGTADAATIGQMAKLILRPDFAEWNWSNPPPDNQLDQVTGIAGNATLTNDWAKRQHTLNDMEPEEVQRPKGYYRKSVKQNNNNARELANHDLIADIMVLALGFCRLPITTVNGTVRAVPNKISADLRTIGYGGADETELANQLGDMANWEPDRYTQNQGVMVANANGGLNWAPVQDSFFEVYKKMADSAATSGLRDYIGGKYNDLMQKFWVALKTSGLVFGSEPSSWAQSLDHGPLIGRRFHQCGPGQMPVFMNKDGQVIPPSEAITWRQGHPFINEGVVDISKGGCGPAIGADIDAGPLSMYGATVAGSMAYKGRAGLPFDASAVLLKELSGYGGRTSKTKMQSKHRKRTATKRRKHKHHKVTSHTTKSRRHPRKARRA